MARIKSDSVVEFRTVSGDALQDAVYAAVVMGFLSEDEARNVGSGCE